MKADHGAPTDIDEYIAGFAPEVQSILRKIRATVRKAVPNARERISYRMPAFALEGDIVYFAAFKKHIGLYPPIRDQKLRKEASIYAGEKGNLRFPLDAPIPYTLIGKIVKARASENQNRSTARRKKGARASTAARRSSSRR